VNCTLCSLHENANNVCISAEPKFHPSLKGCILFVGEGPGRDEDALGRPFVGISGRELRGAIALAFPNRPVVFTNAERCFPGNQDIEKVGALEACRPFLEEEINLYEPSLIVAVGEKAARSLSGMRIPILIANGGGVFWRDEGPHVRYLMHPAFVLRNRAWRSTFRQTVSTILNKNDFNYKSWLFTDVSTVFDPEEAILIINKYTEENEPFAFDVETKGKLFNSDFSILCLGIGKDQDQAYVFPEEVLCDKDVRTALKKLFVTVPGIAHNWKFDAQALTSIGIPLKEIQDPAADTLLWSKLHWPVQNFYFPLNTIAHLVGMGGYYELYFKPILKMCLKAHPGLEERDQYQHAPRDVLWRYNACDVITTYRIYKKLQAEMSEAALNCWNKIYQELPKALGLIESNGIYVSGIEELVARLETSLVQLELLIKTDSLVAGFKTSYGLEFNPGSGAHLGKLIHEVAKMKVQFFTPTKKPKVDAKALGVYAQSKRLGVLNHILERRKIEKLLGTYGKPLLALQDKKGRIHGSYGLVITGRLSCFDPSLQNIPARTNLGRDIRKAFTAPRGRLLVAVDLSQIELRVAAYLSGDPIMINAYRNREDLHLQTAAYVYSILKKKDLLQESPETIKEERRKAKTVNFKLIYGGTGRTLAAELGIEEKEADDIIRLILGRHRKLSALFTRLISEGVRTNESWTYWDGNKFQRRFVEFETSGEGHNQNVFRNNPIQGTAAHYTVASLIKLPKVIEEKHLDAAIVATVHDEILLEAKKAHAEEVGKITRDVMTSWNCGPVPIEAEIKIGENWGDMSVFS